MYSGQFEFSTRVHNCELVGRSAFTPTVVGLQGAPSIRLTTCGMAQTPPYRHLTLQGWACRPRPLLADMRTREPKRGVGPDSYHQTEICPTTPRRSRRAAFQTRHSGKRPADPAGASNWQQLSASSVGANTDEVQPPRPTEVDQLNHVAGLTPAVKHCTELIS